MNLTKRELATILAALRYWRREGLMNGGDYEHLIASNMNTLDPLTADEISDLCMHLNDGTSRD